VGAIAGFKFDGLMAIGRVSFVSADLKIGDRLLSPSPGGNNALKPPAQCMAETAGIG
jgi:hypothetical protein